MAAESRVLEAVKIKLLELNNWFYVYAISIPLVALVLSTIAGMLFGAKAAEVMLGVSILAALFMPPALKQYLLPVYVKIISPAPSRKLLIAILAFFLGLPLAIGGMASLWNTTEDAAKEESATKLEQYETRLESKDYDWLIRHEIPSASGTADAEMIALRDKLVKQKELLFSDKANAERIHTAQLKLAEEKEAARAAEEKKLLEKAKTAKSVADIDYVVNALSTEIKPESNTYKMAQAEITRLRGVLKELREKEAKEHIATAEALARGKSWNQAVSELQMITADASSYAKAQQLVKQFGKQAELQQKRDFTGKWNVSTDRSEMDDTKSVYLSLRAENSIQGWLESSTPTLNIRCMENQTNLFIETGMSSSVEYGTSNHTVELRIDSQKAFRQSWSDSTDNKALFAGNSVGLAKQLAGADKLLFRFTPFNASPQTVEFDVRGLYNHLGEVAKACRWSYTSPF